MWGRPVACAGPLDPQRRPAEGRPQTKGLPHNELFSIGVKQPGERLVVGHAREIGILAGGQPVARL